MFSHYDDEGYGAATEMQNCLSEALPYAIDKRGPVIPEGKGHIFITVRTAVYCQSTDAYAGEMVWHVQRVSSKSECDAWISANVDPQNDDMRVTVSPSPNAAHEVSTKEFSFRNGVFSAEASELSGLEPIRSKATMAFDLVSAKTGKVMRVTRVKIQRDREGEVQWEEFAPAAGNFKVVIFND